MKLLSSRNYLRVAIRSDLTDRNYSAKLKKRSILNIKSALWHSILMRRFFIVLHSVAMYGILKYLFAYNPTSGTTLRQTCNKNNFFDFREKYTYIKGIYMYIYTFLQHISNVTRRT